MKPTRTFDLLERYKALFPDKQDVFASKSDGKWIYQSTEDYYRIAHDFAYGLIILGFAPGDKIVTITNNRPEWNFVDMGMALAGVVHVPVYTSMNRDEYRYIIEHSDAKMVMVSDEKFYSKIRPITDEIINIRYLFTFDEVAKASCWTEVIQKGAGAEEEVRGKIEKLKQEIKPEDLASIIYTSGTTGTHKGVMLSHGNMVSNFIAAAEVFNLGAEDKFLSILPLCHVGGRFGNYQTQYSGTSIYYSESMATIAVNLREIKASGFDAVPRILEKIYDNVLAKGRSLKGFKKKMFFWAVDLGLKYKPFGEKSRFYYTKLKIADKLIFSKWREALGGNVKIVGCGGASLQPRLERVFWASGIKILNMYGLTETSPVITINRQEPPLCRLGSVGALIDGVEVKIADDGEILCKGNNVMLGYYKDEKLTRENIDTNGWFHTGDIGRMEDDRFLMITDRKKEIFKLSSGKFIAPQVIENRLKVSPFIDQMMVTGEHQKFAAAIIVPDIDYLKTVCRKKGTYEEGKPEELLQSKIVKEIFNNEISMLNRSFPDHEKVVKYRLVTDQWSPQTGELSASLKMKRSNIESKYRELLEEMF